MGSPPLRRKSVVCTSRDPNRCGDLPLERRRQNHRATQARHKENKAKAEMTALHASRRKLIPRQNGNVDINTSLFEYNKFQQKPAFCW